MWKAICSTNFEEIDLIDVKNLHLKLLVKKHQIVKVRQKCIFNALRIKKSKFEKWQDMIKKVTHTYTLI